MLVAHGDQGAGYALYVLDGELFFVHNNGRGAMLTVSGGAMPDGVREVVADLRATADRHWELTLSVDGEVRATQPDVPMLFGIAPFEGIDVGIDRRSPVSWEIYERFGPFPYTGTLARGHVHAGRARARRAGADDGHAPRDRRRIRVTARRLGKPDFRRLPGILGACRRIRSANSATRC